MTPHKQEAALAGGSPIESLATGIRREYTTAHPHRRNAGRHGTWIGDTGAAHATAERRGARPTAPTVRTAWVDWLAPHFADTDSAYFTGTYSDEYGYPHGLMLPRNVHKDVERFLDYAGFLDTSERHYICGVERHQYRDILHWHGIIQGPFTDDDRRYLKLLWQNERGFARVLPVQDGCASYITKYALKGDTDSFEWRLS